MKERRQRRGKVQERDAPHGLLEERSRTRRAKPQDRYRLTDAKDIMFEVIGRADAFNRYWDMVVRSMVPGTFTIRDEGGALLCITIKFDEMFNLDRVPDVRG